MTFLTLVELRDKINRELDRGDNPDMPVFLLKGTDPIAPTVIRIWATLTSALYRKSPGALGRHDKCGDAYSDSRTMDVWQEEHGTKIPD